MLDTATKRRIDTARDILVGKVPDPKSQVEQITIALIYKFMDDIDAGSEEMGGQRTFFAGDFARYGWPQLVRAGLGGHETLNLYAEAITRMPENPGIPPLFRDIFNNAYLPYRDPETLRAFLKVIDEFTYDHSERLGDAFEYLLSVLGSQGDAGQFRTPRHIIDFIVAVIDPQKDETILDPACGTAGFLISSYKHILKSNIDDEGNSTLTPDEKGTLAANFKGYDISPDMVRLSLVNLYLHGFVDPHISEYDTLTSEERWNEYADVILANPPFMSPKGGIRPHRRFSVQSKRSEVLFVDYMAEHLTPTGRAGIIVPEGIVFQSQTAYKQLRKMLVEEYLVGVISLPSGVFQPYTGVKTSILVLDKIIAKRNPAILFSEVKDIGFSLGVRRTPTEENDLPYVQSDYQAYYKGQNLSPKSWLVPREKILANGCNLSGTQYRPTLVISNQRMVKVGDVCIMTKGTFSSTKTPPGHYPLILTAAEPKTSAEYQFDQPAVCVPLISSTGHGKATLHRIHFGSGRFALANLLVALQPAKDDDLDVRFLYYVLDAKRNKIAGLMRGAANVGMKPEDLAQFQIPLPPLDIQKDIVAKVEGYQKVIDGARAVIDNYRPQIVVDPEWPMVELGALCKIGGSITKEVDPLCPYFGADSIESNTGKLVKVETIQAQGVSGPVYEFSGERLLYSKIRPYLNKLAIVDLHGYSSSDMYPLLPNYSRVQAPYLANYMLSEAFNEQIQHYYERASIPKINRSQLFETKIPLPPLDIQQAIVAEIEAEQSLVAANRELVERMEGKIRAAIGRVWGKGDTVPAMTKVEND